MLLKRLLFWKRNNANFKIGGIYTVDTGEGFFRIVKILILDPSVLHICMYKNRFKSRPEFVEISALELGTIRDEDDFGVGHIPISIKEFCGWQPKFLIQASVEKAELEGYEIWKNSQGGTF